MILMGKSIRKIWVNNESALQVEEYGRIFPLENKGMGLFISTGGYGFTSPTLGLGVDSVLEIKVLQIIWPRCIIYNYAGFIIVLIVINTSCVILHCFDIFPALY